MLSQSNDITVVRSDALVEPNWDNFLNHLPGAHFEQTSLWGRVKHNYGWLPIRWTAQRNGQIVGGIQLLMRSLPHIGSFGYIMRGPLTETGAVEVQDRLVAEATAFARQHHLLYQVFDCPYEGESLSRVLDKHGYVRHPEGIPPSGLITATLVLDLHPSLDTLLKNMNPSVRRNIRTGQKSDLQAELGGKEHLGAFRDLMHAICVRRGTNPTPPQHDFFERLWEADNGTGMVRLFLVSLGEEIVSAAVAFTISDTLRVWKVGWSGEHHRAYPNHVMWWSIIKWAKENGFGYLDFVWVDDRDAKLMAIGERKPDMFRDGTTFFKMGFGGRLVTVPIPRSQFFHPALRLFDRVGGRRLIESRGSQRLLGRFWSRAVS